MEPGDRLATLGREVPGADVSLEIDHVGSQPRIARVFRALPLGPWPVPNAT